jgi:putative tryptophan/tyrosine transport system substrate-binding protein
MTLSAAGVQLRRAISVVLMALLGFYAGIATSEDARPRVGVVYPQVREPFRAVFQTIAKGIDTELPRRTEVFEIGPDENAGTLSQQLAKRDIDAVILLGTHGLTLSEQLDPSFRRVVGAFLAAPDKVPPNVLATSLAPAPRLLFAKLRELAPGVDRINVIHGADDNDWLIQRAHIAAKELGYNFNPIRMNSIREGANAYRELLQQCGPTDAVWLLQASAFLNESSVLQMILRAAWDRNVVVFSSNGSHVPKGALFALFPDNAAMGAHLARQATRSDIAPGLYPLEQLNTAINIRTSDHLGLGLNAGDSRFNMVFPNR